MSFLHCLAHSAPWSLVFGPCCTFRICLFCSQTHASEQRESRNKIRVFTRGREMLPVRKTEFSSHFLSFINGGFSHLWLFSYFHMMGRGFQVPLNYLLFCKMKTGFKTLFFFGASVSEYVRGFFFLFFFLLSRTRLHPGTTLPHQGLWLWLMTNVNITFNHAAFGSTLWRSGGAQEHNTWIKRQINLYTACRSMSTLLHSLCAPPSPSLQQVAKARINHWSMPLIGPSTFQEKGVGAARAPSSRRCLSVLLPPCQAWSASFLGCLGRDLHTT